MNLYVLINVVNGLICCAGIWACICRLNHMSARTRLCVRAQHVALLTALTVSGFSTPLFLQPVTYGQLATSLVILTGFLITTKRWRHGAPEGTTRPGELA